MLDLALSSVLALWLPVRQGWHTLRGESTLEPWSVVLRQAGLGAIMLAVLIMEIWLLVQLFGWLLADRSPMIEGDDMASCGTDCLALLLPLAPFALLAVIVAGLHLLRLGIRR